MPTQLWIDVEDLFEYARENARPSGIQRLEFEIQQALALRDAGAGRVHFIRHAPLANSFRVVAWSDIAALFAQLTSGRIPAAPVQPGIPGFRPRGPAFRFGRNLVQRLPTSVRPAVIETLLTSGRAGRAWGRLAMTSVREGRAAMRTLARRPAARRTEEAAAGLGSKAAQGGRGVHPDQAGEDVSAASPVVDFATATAPGDVVLVLGSPWFHPDYPGLVRTHREKFQLRFAMLVYDIIPIRRPEWCDQGLVRIFRRWFVPMLPLCDHVFAISQATAADVEAYAAQHGLALRGRVVPVPIGTALSPVVAGQSRSRQDDLLKHDRLEEGALEDPLATREADPSADDWDRPAFSGNDRPLPERNSYALIVSTIEARKNHLLLFRVWRRLLEELPAAQVPKLVFAGRVGWLVDDLMRQISNTAHLDGKLVVLENPTDAELTALYTGCLFTLFPSFYEGWGLPVTESLALGKPCLIANRTSLPEAGAGLARCFDPDNLHDAHAVIRQVIEDRDDLARWEAQVRRDFRPVPWSATVDAFLAELGIAEAACSKEHDVAGEGVAGSAR